MVQYVRVLTWMDLLKRNSLWTLANSQWADWGGHQRKRERERLGETGFCPLPLPVGYWIISRGGWLSTQLFSYRVSCQCINVIPVQPRVSNNNLAQTQLCTDNFRAASASLFHPSNLLLPSLSPMWSLNHSWPRQVQPAYTGGDRASVRS